MRILCYILVVLFVTTSAVGQQINPVPDYIFRNSMSVGRNAPTDTSAYFSIGPRFGATRGFMPPMVVDTAAVTGTKRNGLLIYSIQRNSYLYWDSTGNRWSRLASLSDTVTLSTRAWRQKGIDSLASVRIGGSGVTGYIPKFTAARTLDSSRIFQNSAGEILINDAADSGDYRLQVNGAILTNRFLRLKSTANDWEISAVEGDTLLTIQSRIPQRKQVIIDTASRIFLGLNSNNTGSGSAFALRGRSREVSIGDDVGAYDNGAYALQVKGDMYTNANAIFAASATNTTKGAVGIGTTTPALANNTETNELTVTKSGSGVANIGQLNLQGDRSIDGAGTSRVGTISFWQTTNEIARINGQREGANNSGNLDFQTNSAGGGLTTRMRIHANGRIGLNTSTDAGYQFDVAGSMRNTTDAYFNTSSGETYIGTTSDAGAFRLQVNGVAYAVDGFRTGNPTGGTAATWKLGTVASVSPTSPNRTIEVDIGGTIYYIHAKTTND